MAGFAGVANLTLLRTGGGCQYFRFLEIVELRKRLVFGRIASLALAGMESDPCTIAIRLGGDDAVIPIVTKRLYGDVLFHKASCTLMNMFSHFGTGGGGHGAEIFPIMPKGTPRSIFGCGADGTGIKVHTRFGTGRRGGG